MENNHNNFHSPSQCSQYFCTSNVWEPLVFGQLARIPQWTGLLADAAISTTYQHFCLPLLIFSLQQILESIWFNLFDILFYVNPTNRLLLKWTPLENFFCKEEDIGRGAGQRSSPLLVSFLRAENIVLYSYS